MIWNWMFNILWDELVTGVRDGGRGVLVIFKYSNESGDIYCCLMFVSVFDHSLESIWISYKSFKVLLNCLQNILDGHQYYYSVVLLNLVD